jgi:hypothetical protein
VLLRRNFSRLGALAIALASSLGCASPEDPSQGDASVALYEDDADFALGKADHPNLPAVHAVADYRALHEPRIMTAALAPGDGSALAAGARVLAIRRLLRDGVDSYLVVDDASFEFAVVEAASFDAASRAADADEATSFDYLAALAQTREAVVCQLGSSQQPVRFTLTVDMCQSSRAWELGLFEWLVELSDATGQAVSVGIALTGLWSIHHPSEFRQLLDWQAAGKLDISWVNHSYRHQLSKDAQGHYHFLTAPSVDLRSAVLDLEVLLVEQGETPSPLFRFPGLTHDARTLGELNDLDLFPLDANGWLAKGEPLEHRSVVLLHGNGNEHVGIEMFFDWADANRPALLSGQATLASPLDALPAAGQPFDTCAP